VLLVVARRDGRLEPEDPGSQLIARRRHEGSRGRGFGERERGRAVLLC
jgi:hypothetical protein